VPRRALTLATPWWLTLAQSSSWSQPLFGFYMKRYRDVAGAQSTESDGGTATFGYLDSSLYSGDITYISLPTASEYWEIPMASMSMQGSNINMGGAVAAAIDTGTTLIGGPSDVVAAIYAAIPGSKRMTGSYSNYYEYPCSTNVDYKITFGTNTITMRDADFNLGKYSSDSSLCTGAVFVQDLPANSPIQWIVGDTALKNVYSVYRYQPAAIGFASLPGSATTSGVSTTIPVISSLQADSSTASSASASSSSTRSSSSNSSATASVLASATRADLPTSIAPARVVTAETTVFVDPTSASSGANNAATPTKTGAASPRSLISVSLIGLALAIAGHMTM
jgi:cathepsin D